MKILMLNHEFPPVGGGASPVTFELSRQLVEMGHSVDVVTMHYADLARFEVVDGVSIYRTPALRRKPNICYTYELATYILGAFIKTVRLAKQKKYDIIHCHFIIPGGPLAWLVSKLTGIPYLITCHGSDVPGHNPDRFGLLYKLVTPAWRFLAKNTTVLTSPSESLKALIIKNCPKAQVRIIPNGIHTDRFKSTEKTKSILMCSRIFNFKGFQYAIEAFKDMDLDWQVNIVGEGPYLPELKRLAEGSKPAIKFWGWLDHNGPELKHLYESSSIFIFPSEAESFGLVVAEAMAAGNAIIASDIGAHREVLGDAGVLVKPRDVAGIRDNLEKLISSEKLRQQLAAAALERVQQFDWRNIASKFVELYEQTI